MEAIKKLISFGQEPSPGSNDPFNSKKQFFITVLVFGVILFALCLLFHIQPSLAGTSLPGEDASDKLEAAGTLLKILDTGMFKWGARLFAGMCIMSGAWALKEQRFGIAIICIIGAIILGTAPKWVKNIFDIGGNQGLFSKIDYDPQNSIVTTRVLTV